MRAAAAAAGKWRVAAAGVQAAASGVGGVRRRECEQQPEAAAGEQRAGVAPPRAPPGQVEG